MPETLDEVLLNRTSFTQAYVEQQSKLNEQKFLALSRNFELFKTHMEQAQLLRNNEFEARITNIEGKVEKCIKQISGILDRLVDCEGLSNVKTLLQPIHAKSNILESKIKEQSEYFEMNTNEIVKRVVAAIKEEQQGRQAFEESIRSEKEELDKKLDMVFSKIGSMLEKQKGNERQYGDKASPRLAGSSRKHINSNRKRVLRSQSHSDILHSRSAKNVSSPTSSSGSISSRFKDSNNMESPKNRGNLLDSPPVTARQIMTSSARSKSNTTHVAEAGSNVIETLPVLDTSNSIFEESDKKAVQAKTQYKHAGSSSEDGDDAPPPFEPWMQNSHSNRYGDTTNISFPKKQKYGWGRLTSFVKNKFGKRRKANSFA